MHLIVPGHRWFLPYKKGNDLFSPTLFQLELFLMPTRWKKEVFHLASLCARLRPVGMPGGGCLVKNNKEVLHLGSLCPRVRLVNNTICNPNFRKTPTTFAAIIGAFITRRNMDIKNLLVSPCAKGCQVSDLFIIFDQAYPNWRTLAQGLVRWRTYLLFWTERASYQGFLQKTFTCLPMDWPLS